MKKHILIMILAALLLFVACQPTPENPIVVGKDQTEMLNKAKETLAPEKLEQSLRERLNVPDRYTYSYHKGDLTIDADAEIVVPDGELPIVRVFPREFDQATVTTLWNVLIGDTPMQIQQEGMTKAEIAEELEAMIAALDANEPQAFGFETVEQLEKRITLYQKKYNEAPDVLDGEPADGTLYTESEYDNSGNVTASHTCVRAQSKEAGIRFIVSNGYDNDAPVKTILYDDIGREIGYSVRSVERKSSFVFIKDNDPHVGCYVWDDELRPSDGIPEKAAHSIGILPQNAWDTAQKLLEDMDLSDAYRLQRIFLITDVGPDNIPREYAYRIVCTHVVNGAQTLMIGNADDEGADDPFVPSWQFERFYIDVGDDGVYCIQHETPLAVGETILTQTNLLPFSEIQAIIKKMLPIMYENETDDYDGKSFEKHIDRVELGLWRVREQNRIDRGLLVPVWAIYAVTAEIDSYINFAWRSYEPILLINAVDGTIIDPLLGY